MRAVIKTIPILIGLGLGATQVTAQRGRMYSYVDHDAGRYVVSPHELRLCLAELDVVARLATALSSVTPEAYYAYVQTNSLPDTPRLNQLTSEQFNHVYWCFQQKKGKFWPSKFRVGQVGKWVPRIRIVDKYAYQSAIVDLGGFPAVLESDEIAGLVNDSEFREKKSLRITGSKVFPSPSARAGAWFDLRHSGTVEQEVVEERQEGGKMKVRGQDVEEKEKVARNKEKTSYEKEATVNGSSSSTSRRRTTTIEDYAPIEVFVLSTETDAERQSRLKSEETSRKTSSARVTDAEQIAATKLKLIKELLADPKSADAGRYRLEKLIKDYPNTKAAKEAKDLLDK